jgi:hypothetical protein
VPVCREYSSVGAIFASPQMKGTQLNNISKKPIIIGSRLRNDEAVILESDMIEDPT